MARRSSTGVPNADFVQMHLQVGRAVVEPISVRTREPLLAIAAERSLMPKNRGQRAATRSQAPPPMAAEPWMSAPGRRTKITNRSGSGLAWRA